MLLLCSQRSATQKLSKQRNLELGKTARRTATTPGHCDIGLEGRREQVAAKGGTETCVVDRQEAPSSWHIKRRSYVLSSR